MNRNSKNLKRFGFTLIELLIVVAIIAILAAIAVPNFLEAQTRSKIARVHSDMRTLSVGIEMYSVDYNRAPLELDEIDKLPAFAGLIWWDRVYLSRCVLTSPQAYITNIPLDPFCTISGQVNNKGIRADRKFFEYETLYSATSGYSAKAKSKGYTWHMASFGPSRSATAMYESPLRWTSVEYALAGIASSAKGIMHPDIYYDSTNGTMSFGRIVRSNKGVEPTQK